MSYNAPVINGKYKVKKQFDRGAFGDIYVGVHIQSGVEVAIKVEPEEPKFAQLEHEGGVYKQLNGCLGIPQTYFSGRAYNQQCLVMELMGPSLEDLFDFCNRRFSLKTVLMLGVSMFDIIEDMHSRNFIYRDIKPDNFVMGRGSNRGELHLIDMGLAREYKNRKTGGHIPYRTGLPFVGTARYVSINTHKGDEQSRRDDLEAIIYVLIYFLKGKLPWQHLEGDSKDKNHSAIAQMKAAYPVNLLCEGLPLEFAMSLEQCRLLEFVEDPDYKQICQIFHTCLTSHGFTLDGNYDWNY